MIVSGSEATLMAAASGSDSERKQIIEVSGFVSVESTRF